MFLSINITVQSCSTSPPCPFSKLFYFDTTQKGKGVAHLQSHLKESHHESLTISQRLRGLKTSLKRKPEGAGPVQPWEEVLEEQGILSRHTNTLRADVQTGPRLFPGVPSERIRGDKHKLKHRKFHLKMNKKFIFFESNSTGTGCSEGLWNLLHMEILQHHLDAILYNLLNLL